MLYSPWETNQQQQAHPPELNHQHFVTDAMFERSTTIAYSSKSTTTTKVLATTT